MEKNPELERRLDLIDVSSEDDCLISVCSDSGYQNDPGYFELSEAGIALEREGTMHANMGKNQVLEPERTRKTGKCNLRKSLAWDSAFFTSPGVLEPEELSFINSGLVKTDVHRLPGIDELRRSGESNSTFESDDMTLESLEVGLFEDVRASIQRSKGFCGQAESGESSMRSLQSTKKIGIPSANKMKALSGPKRQIISKQQGLEKPVKETEKIKKEIEKSKREAGGIKKDAAARPRVTQAGARSGEVQHNMSVRPPKIVGRANPVSTSPIKKSSLCNTRAKIDSTSNLKSSIDRRETIGSLKRPVLNEPRSTPSPRSSSIKRSSSSPLSRDGNSSSSSDKSPVTNMLKKKTSNLKSPLRSSSSLSSISQTGGDCRLSGYLSSISKRSSSISPASSIDGWSSESSSSTSVYQCSNSDMSSPRKGFSLDKVVIPKKHQSTSSVEQKRAVLPSPVTKKSIMTGSSKPSGLRMPSPKLGFFDAEKSSSTTEASRSGVGVRSGIPKHGSSLRAKPLLASASSSSKRETEATSLRRPPPSPRKQELPVTPTSTQIIKHRITTARKLKPEKVGENNNNSIKEEDCPQEVQKDMLDETGEVGVGGSCSSIKENLAASDETREVMRDTTEEKDCYPTASGETETVERKIEEGAQDVVGTDISDAVEHGAQDVVGIHISKEGAQDVVGTDIGTVSISDAEQGAQDVVGIPSVAAQCLDSSKEGAQDVVGDATAAQCLDKKEGAQDVVWTDIGISDAADSETGYGQGGDNGLGHVEERSNEKENSGLSMHNMEESTDKKDETNTRDDGTQVSKEFHIETAAHSPSKRTPLALCNGTSTTSTTELASESKTYHPSSITQVPQEDNS